MSLDYVIVLFTVVALIMATVTKKLYRDRNLVRIKSTINSKFYIVRQSKNSEEAANMLARLEQKINEINTILQRDEARKKYPQHREHIEQMNAALPHMELKESDPNTKHTSYTINKGETMIVCLRSKVDGRIHDENLVLYVVLHELAHVACPEWGHTPLFTQIFRMITEVATEHGVYKRIDFENHPAVYCGMNITHAII